MDSATVNFAGRTFGAVLHLPDALKLFPEAGHAIYNRVSTDSQAGKSRVKLQAKTDAVHEAYRHVVPPPPFRLFSPPTEAPVIFQGVEEGKLSKRRKTLSEAVRYCLNQDTQMILVASDLSRLIRSELYHRQKNPHVRPTQDEFQQLRERTRGVILATVLDPLASESERHSYLTKRTGKAGRPPKINCQLAMEILRLYGPGHRSQPGRKGRWYEDVSLSDIAKHFTNKGIPLSKSAIRRLLDSFTPDPDHPGVRWKDCAYPYMAYRETWLKLGRPTHFPRTSGRVG